MVILHSYATATGNGTDVLRTTRVRWRAGRHQTSSFTQPRAKSTGSGPRVLSVFYRFCGVHNARQTTVFRSDSPGEVHGRNRYARHYAQGRAGIRSRTRRNYTSKSVLRYAVRIPRVSEYLIFIRFMHRLLRKNSMSKKTKKQNSTKNKFTDDFMNVVV